MQCRARACLMASNFFLSCHARRLTDIYKIRLINIKSCHYEAFYLQEGLSFKF